MTDYCEYCGALLEPGVNYCSECGEPVDTVDEGWGTVTIEEEQGKYAGPDDDTTQAMLAHILALVLWVIGPAIILVTAEDEFTEQNARNALNWQIMFTIYMIISIILVFVLVGILFVFLLPLVDMAFCIIAAIKANEGEAWKYPLTPDIV